MIQELGKFEYFKTYKKVKVVFLKDEENNYIENLQMLIFLGDYKNPVYATKLNSFEFYEKEVFDRVRVWEKIPFVHNNVNHRVVKKIKLKDSEMKKLKGFLKQFNLKTIELTFGEVIRSINKVDGSQFTERPKKNKKVRKREQLILS